MTAWRIRDLQPHDLDGLLRLWDEYRRTGAEPVYALNEVLASTRALPQRLLAAGFEHRHEHLDDALDHLLT